MKASPEQRKAMKQIYDKLKGKPVEFIHKIQRIPVLTDEQKRIVESVWKNKLTIAPSGHGLGKSFLAGAIVLAFLYTHKNSIVITTAPTYRQVKDILWKNIREIHSKSLKIGHITPNILNLDLSEHWFAVGFATSPGADEVSAVKFQGYHAPHILVVLDEAGGLQSAIWEAVDGIISSDGGRCLAIGNPSKRGTPFHKAVMSDNWNKIQLSALNHPNIKAKSEIIPGAVSYGWVKSKITEWCEPTQYKQPGSFTFEGVEYIPNGLFKWKVLGEFPNEDDNTLFSEETLTACFSRKDGTEKMGRELLGADIARLGSDLTVLCRIKDNLVSFKDYSKIVTTKSTEIIMMHNVIYSPDITVVDADGVGGGVYDQLKQKKLSGLYAFHGGEKALDRVAGKKTELKFLNKRSQAYYYLSKDIHKMAIPKNEKLREELLATYMYVRAKDGNICVVPKDEIKDTIGRSPDYADALAYANFGRYVKSGVLQVRTQI